MLIGLILMVLGFVMLGIASWMCALLRERAFKPRRAYRSYSRRQYDMFATLWRVGLGVSGIPAVLLLYAAYSGEDQWIGKLKGVLGRFMQLRIVGRARKAMHLLRWRAKEYAAERKAARPLQAGQAPAVQPRKVKNLV